MKRWTKGLTLLAGLALASAACEDGITDNQAVDDASLQAEVALVAADAMFRDLSLMQNPGIGQLGFPGAGLASSATPPQAAATSGACQSKGPGQGFQCSTMVQKEFSITREVTFLDENGGIQDAYDPLETATIELLMNASGTVERPFWSASIQRERDLTITGLAGEETEHTVNGTAAGQVFRSHDPQEGETRTRDMTTTAEIEDVVHAVPRRENPYPLSGSITRTVHVIVKEGEEVLRERDVTTVITFNGTQFVTLLVDGEEYSIDLSQREVKGRFHKKGG